MTTRAKSRRLALLPTGELRARGWSGQTHLPTPLELLRDRALGVGLEPVCRWCSHFLGDWCKVTDATQIPDGVCLDWNPDPEITT